MTIVYLRLKKKLNIVNDTEVTLKQLAYISSTATQTNELANTVIYSFKEKDKPVSVIDGFSVVKQLNMIYQDYEFQLIGPAETIINRLNKQKQANLMYICLVWILLFIGTAMTIMNFHLDVGMQDVQQKLHLLFTGKNNKFPLLIQIPYSIGLGLGMVIYLNHWFKTRINDEPSPLEIELYNYEANIEEYVKYNENDLNDDHD